MGRHGGKTIHSHRLWAVTELMKQTFGLEMNKIGTQRVRVDGDRMRIQKYQLGWPDVEGLPVVPADTWQAVM